MISATQTQTANAQGSCPEDNTPIRKLQRIRQRIRWHLIRRFHSGSWVLNLGVLGALALVWAFFLYEDRREYKDVIFDAGMETAMQSQVLAEYSRSTIRRVDEYLQDLRSSWNRDARTFSEVVKRRHETVNDISFQVAVIGPDGFLAYSNLSVTKERIDLGEREHFRVHAKHPGVDRLFISDPLKGKVSQKWSIQFTRPIYSNGKFNGVIVISVGPEQFASFSRNLNVSPGGIVTVVKDSGKIIARQPMIEGALERTLHGVPFLSSSSPESGNLRLRSQADGIERVYGFHRMPEYGLTAVVGASLDHVLEPYREQRAAMLRTAALISILLSLLQYVLHRFFAERRRAEDQHRIAALVYQASSEGMVVTTANGQILAVNPAFTSLTGYTAEEVIGKTPAILQSGRHDARFYADMWAQIEASGHWQGEIWNRRKGGKIYPQWLTINTTYGVEGCALRRVALFSDISEKKKSEELIWQHANFDTLTGLPNRRMFNDRLSLQIKRAHRVHLPFAVLLLDLDRFKEVNDTLGHHAGDALLIEVAARLRSCVRESDTVARLGGDEFTVILGEPSEDEAVQRVVEAIHAKVAEPFNLNGEVVHTTASVGVTFYPRNASDPESLMKQADQAMFAAKAQGPNRCSYFTAAMQSAIQARMRLIADMREALAQSQFRLHYQPIVELATGRIRKVEALLRWTHPTRGSVSPAEFIPIAEETGMIAELGDWVFGQALDDMARWREMFSTQFQVGINMSPLQLRDTKGTVAGWPQRLQERGIAEHSVVVEITESALMEEGAFVAARMTELRDAGMLISLDDFGTGYSSLAYLKKFQVDYLKIDQSFVQSLNGEARDAALCEAIIVMAHKMGIEVVAEGVETQAQLDFLRKSGCDYAQGYLISRPVPRGEFEDLMRSMEGISQPPWLARWEVPKASTFQDAGPIEMRHATGL
jgi:diguanylate cyclase (GGDEF)-like protein/PAS domain S-box-containing protein